MNFNIFNILIIVGIVQGLVYTVVVLSSKKFQSRSTLYLTALIFVYTLNNIMYILPDIGVMTLDHMYGYYFIPLAPLIPVLIYLYVVFFLNPNRNLAIKDKLFFLPFIFFLIVFIGFKLIVFLSVPSETTIKLFGFFVHLNEIFAVLYSIVLLSIALKVVYSYDKLQKITNVKLIKHNLNWLKLMLLIIFTFTFYWAYITYINIFLGTLKGFEFYILWLVMATLIYMFGHFGLYKYGILKERKKIRQYLEKINFKSSESKATSKENYTSNNKHIQLLNNLFLNDKIFLDPNLSLESAADHLKLSPSYLSKLIHNELKTNFPEYLNSFRVDEVKGYLKNPEFSHYTILAIGLEAGFNSKSSFYNIFKTSTGQTPSAFRKTKTN